MKICIPISEEKGLESVPYSHFGSAPFLLVYNTETDEFEIANNQNQHHAHGMCQPMNALDNKLIDAIVVGGIGQRAISKLNNLGIKIFQSTEGTVKQNIDSLKQNKLIELTQENACAHHGYRGGCGS